jgi:hypothetical protein
MIALFLADILLLVSLVVLLLLQRPGSGLSSFSPYSDEIWTNSQAPACTTQLYKEQTKAATETTCSGSFCLEVNHRG